MNTNKSTVRTIEILHLIAASQKHLTVTEVSQALKIPKSTTYQILQTLVELRILENSNSKTYQLGIRFFEISLPAFARMDLRREAQPILEELSARTGETVFMATHDSGEIVYLDQVMGPSLLRLSVNPGTRGPIHCTALGKAILAAMPEERVAEITGGGELPTCTEFTLCSHQDLMADLKSTRTRGYAVDDRELLPDISCVAAPVYGAKGEVLAAISIVGHSSRMNSGRLETLGGFVREAALKLSLRLGYQDRRLFT